MCIYGIFLNKHLHDGDYFFFMWVFPGRAETPASWKRFIWNLRVPPQSQARLSTSSVHILHIVLQTQSKHHLNHNWRVLLIVCAKMLNFNPVTMKQRGLKHFNNTYSASNTRLWIYWLCKQSCINSIGGILKGSFQKLKTRVFNHK